MKVAPIDKKVIDRKFVTELTCTINLEIGILEHIPEDLIGHFMMIKNL
jgi:hypothetical protein